MQAFSINHRGLKLKVSFDTYKGNGRLAVLLTSADGTPYTTLSCNVKEADIEPDEFVVKAWSENTEIAEACRPYFIDTGKRIQTGYVIAEVWRLKVDLKIVIMQDDRTPIAVFDTEQEAHDYIERSTKFRWTLFKVQYKP